MIKTIVKDNSGDLDKEVNDFMSTLESNLPVRTECFLFQDKVWHKATIFFDYAFPKPAVATEEITEEVMVLEEEEEASGFVEQKSLPNPDKLGALWERNGKISGLFKDEKLVIPESSAKKLLHDEVPMACTIKGETVNIIKNKFKKSSKQPDFVIMRAKK